MAEMSRSERRASRPAMPLHDHLAALPVLIRKLGHCFQDVTLLDMALTHPSWRNEHSPGQADNQRLEFLGDAVIGLVITQELVQRLPQRCEGELTVLKSQLVRESSLAALAEELMVGQALRLGRGEDQSGGRQRVSVLADAMEALLGAVFLDAGYEKTREVVLELFGRALVAVISQVEAPGLPLSATTANWKTAVQELLQRLGTQPPVYTLVAEEGPVHTRRFRVEATTLLGVQTLAAMGEGASKKAAENEAAEGLYRQVAESRSAPPPGHESGTNVQERKAYVAL